MAPTRTLKCDQAHSDAHLWQGFIFTIIYFEFGAYVLIRQIVNAFEYLVAWRGHKSQLRQGMRKAKTYEEWVEAATKLDEYLGFNEWKEIEEDSYFDHILVNLRLVPLPAKLTPGQTCKTHSDQTSTGEGYEGTHGCLGRLREEQLWWYGRGEDVQRGQFNRTARTTS